MWKHKTVRLHRGVQFRLASGLNAEMTVLKDAEAKEIAKKCLETRRMCELLFSQLNHEQGECSLVKIGVNNKFLLLVYRPLKQNQQKKLLNELKTCPPNTLQWLFFAVYRNTIYPFYHPTTPLLMEICTTGLSPDICALTMRK